MTSYPVDDIINSSYYDVMAMQRKRQNQALAACDSLSLRPWTGHQLRRAIRHSGVFYVDDGLRYIYCMVPKAACTTWTRVLLVASGKVTCFVYY